MGRKKKTQRLMTARERIAAADADEHRVVDDVMEEAQRMHLRPPVHIRLAPDPMAQRRAANQVRRWMKARGGQEQSAADKAFIDRVFEAGRVEGLKRIACVCGRDEKTLRTAYNADPWVRRWIHKTRGRYWADPMELWANLGPYFADRRAAARQASAMKQARGGRGAFAKR